ncbi:hypothetical protein ACFYVL_06435 [Streptomyces sp. NPDC004111]|uniref:hypothetical protein n=1 Tax=Streptomyces sp. NPDC004111 TaxID=3364690 RepID=UPI0036ABB846
MALLAVLLPVFMLGAILALGRLEDILFAPPAAEGAERAARPGRHARKTARKRATPAVRFGRHAKEGV